METGRTRSLHSVQPSSWPSPAGFVLAAEVLCCLFLNLQQTLGRFCLSLRFIHSFIHSKELAHVIVEAGQVHNLQGGPADRRSREELLLQLDCEGCQWENSVLLGESESFLLEGPYLVR